jgi:gas vesicle protein
VVSRAKRKAKKAEKKAAKKRRGGFLIGALIGGVVALLAAPKTGKETREQLKSAAGGGEGRGGFDFKGQADKIKDAVGAGRESASDQSEALKRKIEETRTRLREQMDEVE